MSDFFFFFQAEDGIRDVAVTGVQTCALPIYLDRIREYEQRAFDMEKQIARRCPAPDAPGESDIIHGDEADPGGQGIDITVEELVSEWRLMADLYALAIQCDRVRFGSITFLSAGERIRLKGKYEYNGRRV